MKDIAIRLLGIAAIQFVVKNRVEKKNIFVDAFNVYNEAPTISEGDIVLFTHDDRDHFCADKLPDISSKQVSVFGPPSIVLPLVRSQKIKLDQLIIEYPPEENIPKTYEVDGIKISFFQTNHFIDWHPIHCSFLIEISNRKIFVTGDSAIVDSQTYLKDIDCIVCNLIEKGFLRKTEDPRYAIHHHLSYLLRILSLYNPKMIVASHLINHKGAVDQRR